MPGRGKGGKGLGVGVAKRHRRFIRDSIQGIAKPVIRDTVTYAEHAKRKPSPHLTSFMLSNVQGVLSMALALEMLH
ncbi:hypothetical protein EI94DRAFT_569295 [Lactarius quietus]|nr:hypothetical protein EI94DRAFT_569295 [Lactarius quietus]